MQAKRGYRSNRKDDGQQKMELQHIAHAYDEADEQAIDQHKKPRGLGMAEAEIDQKVVDMAAVGPERRLSAYDAGDEWYQITE